jgi:hypothetical protein
MSGVASLSFCRGAEWKRYLRPTCIFPGVVLDLGDAPLPGATSS